MNPPPDPPALARRAAMLREAADAFPPGRDRDLLLIQLQSLEDRWRVPAAILEQAAAPPARVQIDAAA